MSTAFDNLDDYVALPRVSDLAVSPDGSRVVTTISELHANRTEYVSAIWELDPEGRQPARRITHGAKGESAPTFSANSDLLFIASRHLDGEDDDGEKLTVGLWRLPAAGGEAEPVVQLPGGVNGIRTARADSTIAVIGPMLPSATTIEDDRRLREVRDTEEVTAILHRGYPIRYWDKDLGPDQNHLFRVGEGGAPVDVTHSPGVSLRDGDVCLSPDGRFAVAAWRLAQAGPSTRVVLVHIDLITGQRKIIADDPAADFEHPVISPDGTAVAFTRESFSNPDRAPRITLCIMEFESATVTEIAREWQRWSLSVVWTPDGRALLVTADDNGRCPIFRVTLGGAVNQLTRDDFSYTDVNAAPDGVIYALRSSYAAPPHPVRIDPSASVIDPSVGVTALPCVDLPELPGALTEIAATTADGLCVRSWLVLPDTSRPAPLLLWIHGGPLNSWNSWSWRWNPWLMAARGYAVLLPDPALSTGYGQDFIQRGWGRWGGPPYEDLMAAVDAACADARIDPSRTGAMGGSFGGYMANWIAGHTDRFQAIVTHASIWSLDQFGATTDNAYYWVREMTSAMAQANSPDSWVGDINTPMLVIHGDKDFRVPIGEGIRLWYDLLSKSKLPADAQGNSPHQMLYFPDENHWVLAPQHAKIWYQVVTAFLAEHVLGETVPLPEALG